MMRTIKLEITMFLSLFSLDSPLIGTSLVANLVLLNSYGCLRL